MKAVKLFFQHEMAGGILLFSAAVAALAAANLPVLSELYAQLLDTPIAVKIGALKIDKPMLLWVNDGLMAMFFLLVGLELKREFYEGELSDWRKVMLPGMGALGGMFVPAMIYIAFNYHDSFALHGWAIPAATDIAFALGVLTLLGSRVPLTIKVFLTSLAIFDDIGAIIVIAIFYTSKISFVALGIAALCIVALYVVNRKGVCRLLPYMLIGTVLWVAVLKSGVHATLAGVILAIFIPMRNPRNTELSPLRWLEHSLHTAVLFVTLPVFAFCNAGIPLLDVGIEQITHSIPLGIAMGLVFGKLIGVFCFSMIPVLLGWVTLPKEFSRMSLLGVSALCGIGFTMSLFIGALAFESGGDNLMFDERIGIMIGSIISGFAGYFILRYSLPKAKPVAA